MKFRPTWNFGPGQLAKQRWTYMDPRMELLIDTEKLPARTPVYELNLWSYAANIWRKYDPSFLIPDMSMSMFIIQDLLEALRPLDVYQMSTFDGRDKLIRVADIYGGCVNTDSDEHMYPWLRDSQYALVKAVHKMRRYVPNPRYRTNYICPVDHQALASRLKAYGAAYEFPKQRELG